MSWILSMLLTVATEIGAARTDRTWTGPALAERIESTLDQAGRMSGSSLTIDVRDHLAIVRGRVATIDQAERIAAVCFATDGVYGAVQLVDIAATSYDAQTAGDRLQEQFEKSAGLACARLVASALPERKIVIGGEAGTLDEVELARELASRIEGVREIKITARINPLLLRSDESIEAQIAFQTQDDPLLAGFPVRFSVREGRLAIIGKVGSEEARRRLALKSMIAGIREADLDQLRVDPALKCDGMSPKRYHPEDALKVLDLVFSMDPRLEDTSYQLHLDGARLVVSAPSVTHDEVNAMIDDGRGLPGIEQLIFPLPASAVHALGRR